MSAEPGQGSPDSEVKRDPEFVSAEPGQGSPDSEVKRDPEFVSAEPEALGALGRAGVVAVIRAGSLGHAVALGRSLAGAGVRAIEVTFTTPRAPRAIAALRQEVPAGLLVGAGTLTTTEQAEAAADAGADFLVSPGFEPSLWKAMRSLHPVAIPGVLTPSELVGARLAGALAVKLFPAAAMGVEYLRALQMPFPDLKVIPTGGISASNLEEWIRAGAFAVGIGGALSPRARCSPEDAARRVREPARAALDALANARAERGS